jgi:hypothetical protein
MVILYVKSRFVFITRGVQLDNVVDPLWRMLCQVSHTHHYM